MRARNWISVIVIAFVVVLNWSTITEFLEHEKITGEAVSDILEKEIPEEIKTDHKVYFCPRDGCAEQLVEWIELAEKEVHCAFYDVDIEDVKEALERKEKEGVDVKLVVDTDNKEFWEGLNFFIADERSAIMHNKFCVIDDQVVWTGSFNPTFRGNEKNNNNAVVYQSKYLAENYEDEFWEMWEGRFGRGERVKYPGVIVDGVKIENYFCPEDWCGNKVIYALQEANKSIYFMTFSFTHDEIGEEIISKFEEGVEVKGVFEKSQNNKYNEYKKMEEAGMDVRWDGNKYNMHHKVFVIDEKTVVTGSFNPSKNGDERNDENVLIIHDPEVAGEFVEEFERVWGEAG